ncbi:MAG: MotA/TolQ/ExbB proton channel family protein, partial [Verrucomicrobiales bacterium]
LGTVIGMIKSFMDISKGNFEGVKQLEMARGVWEALITTAGGLTIGIVAIAFYSIFRGRVQRLVSELESASTHILAIIGSQLQSRQQAGNDYDSPSPMRQARGE